VTEHLRTDSVVRAITKDGAFRVVAARTTETVRGAIGAQSAAGAVAKHFGELITGAILVRETMAPKLRVQGILKSAKGKGSLVADSHPDGTSRGLISVGRGGGEIDVGRGALLQVMRTLPSGMLHQGLVEIPEAGGISAGLMAYMQDSEQVVSTIGVATVLKGDDVIAAGGYMVQLLPEVERGPLMIMTERLQDFPRLDEVLASHDASPDHLLSEILYGMPFARLNESSLRFACQCSRVRVISSLATLPRSDIEEMVNDGKLLEINCDFCGKEYAVAPAELRSMLLPPS
jgi:molecular chaperone Hsp33